MELELFHFQVVLATFFCNVSQDKCKKSPKERFKPTVFYLSCYRAQILAKRGKICLLLLTKSFRHTESLKMTLVWRLGIWPVLLLMSFIFDELTYLFMFWRVDFWRVGFWRVDVASFLPQEREGMQQMTPFKNWIAVYVKQV